MTHYGCRKIIELAADEKGVTFEELIKIFFEYTLTINAGDTSHAPGTTKKFYGGPGKLVYSIYPDGGATARPVEGTHTVYRKSEERQ